MFLSADELSWVDEQIEAIKPPREGVSNYEISRIKSPFVFLYKQKNLKTKQDKKNKTATRKKVVTNVSKNTLVKSSHHVGLRLSAIINGSALINGKWYKAGQNVYDYKVADVRLTSVLLIRGNKKLLLSTNDLKRNLKFR
jgi:hypothetical protein